MNRRILNVRNILIILTPLAIIFIVIAIYSKDLKLKNDDLYFTPFTDEGENAGKSDIIDTTFLKDSFILTFELNEGFISPYAGVSLTPKTAEYIDLNSYDFIAFDLELENTKNLEITLATYQNGITKENLPLSFRHNVFEIPISSDQNTYTIAIKDLRIAQWWLERYRVQSSELGEINLKKTSSISFVAKIRLDENTPQKLKIRNIHFYNDKSYLYTASAILLLLYYAGLGFIQFYKKSKNKGLVIQYEQITNTTEDNEYDKLMIFIAQNYTNSELTLSTVSEETGLSEKKISLYIKDKYASSFKEYLNGIRINEAKRLLKESDLNINEIAYNVGFNSPNHFNRTFKNSTNTTPSIYRKTSA